MTHILRERAAAAPLETALTDCDTSFTWAELADTCERAVHALASVQLAPDARVAIIARNSAPATLAYLMARYSGVQTVAASFHLRPEEIRYILTDAHVGAVFCDESTRSAVEAGCALAGISTVFSVDAPAGDARNFMEWVASFPTGEPNLEVPGAPNVLYTSGTTGFPKGVLNPQNLTGTLRSYIEEYREPVGVGPYLTVGPMYHAGPIGSIRRLTGGRPLVVLKQFAAEGVLNIIHTHRVSGTTMVPTHFAKLLELPAEVRAKYDLSCLAFLDHTGSSCPPAVKEAMINWVGPILSDRYGATESGTICSISSTEWLAHRGSVGKCASRFTAHVVDDNDVEVPVGQTGRLFFIDHTGVGLNYMNAPEKTASAHLRPGVFTLGDLGYVDSDGYVFITGRTADTVISGGVNLYPAEIERVLNECPLVVEAAVIGVPDDVMGETLMAFVVPRDASTTEAAVIAYCRELLAGPKVPRAMEFVDELPRNPMGKLDRKVLRAPYWDTL